MMKHIASSNPSLSCMNTNDNSIPSMRDIFNIRMVYPGEKKSIYWPTEDDSFIKDLDTYFPKIVALSTLFNKDTFIIYRCVTQLSLNAYSIILTFNKNIDILIQFIENVMWIHIKNESNNKKLVWKYFKMTNNYIINIPSFGSVNILSLLNHYNINFDDINYKINCNQNIYWHKDAPFIMSDKVKWDIKSIPLPKKKIKKLIKQNKSEMIGLIYIDLDKKPQWIQCIIPLNLIIFTQYNSTTNKYVIKEVTTMSNFSKVYLWSSFYNISKHVSINLQKKSITIPNIAILEKSKYIATISRTIYFTPKLIKFDKILNESPIYPNSNSILLTMDNPNVWHSNPILK